MSLSQKFTRTFLMASGAAYTYKENTLQNGVQNWNIYNQFMVRNPAMALATDQDRKRFKNMNTNVYVWGEGFQVDSTQDFSNYTPKKIKAFAGKDNPNIIDVAFGWYHEAYIDSKGKLYVCSKAKMTSIKVKEIQDGARADMTQVTSFKGKAKQVTFTRQRMFVLNEQGQIFVYIIEEKKPEQFAIPHHRLENMYTGELELHKAIYVKDLKNIKQMASGVDHILFLDNDGQVFAMGDDTFGQCAQSGDGRNTSAPFFEVRHRTPQKVNFNKQVKINKVISGYRHCLAISEDGKLYGWGFNSMQQLEDPDGYSADNPIHAFFEPVEFKGELERKFVVDAAAGEEHTIVVAQVRREGKKVSEVIYGCGNNLKGQLGINRTCHLTDFVLLEDISELYENTDKGIQPLTVNKLVCGKRHCIAQFDYGAFFFWGDNEFGQLGNRKRSYLESPFPKKKFELNHNVENVITDIDSCAVIVEDLGKAKKKNKKKKKREITLAEIAATEAQIKHENEKRLAAQQKKDAEDEVPDVRSRVSLDQRFRNKFHDMFYKTKGQKEREARAQLEKEEQERLESQKQSSQSEDQDPKKQD